MLIYKLCAVMAHICILLSVILVMLSVSANSEENNNYDEIDPIIDIMLLNSEYDNDGMTPNENVDEKDHEETMIDSVPILYPDGVWKCGNCTNMDKMRLLYNEVYDQDNNYDDYVEEYQLNVEIQIGLSLSNMRCITLQADEEMDVRLVTGACTGGQVTFGIMRAAHCLISVYG